MDSHQGVHKLLHRRISLLAATRCVRQGQQNQETGGQEYLEFRLHFKSSTFNARVRRSLLSTTNSPERLTFRKAVLVRTGECVGSMLWWISLRTKLNCDHCGETRNLGL